MSNSVHLATPHLFINIGVRFIRNDGSTSDILSGNDIEIRSRGQTISMVIQERGSKKVHVDTSLKKGIVGYRVNKFCFSVLLDDQPIMIIFEKTDDLERFEVLLYLITGQQPSSKCRFNERTEESSAVQYFQFYGYLSQQQNMMQDYTRTSTYQRAILQNISDFKDKVVLDVGAGTGILSFFALQAGAKKVYAVEASTMAQHAEKLVSHNNASTIIEVIAGKIEEIDLPEDVDVIISEPMGYMLFNERMLETYLHAKKWLKPNGKMFPTRGDIHIAPFTDDSLYMEHYSKSNFWCQNSFYGVDLTSLRQAAIQEYFKQPIVDTFDVRILMAKPCTYQVDFLTTKERDLERIHIPLQYTMLMTGTLHGLAFWFDVGFFGSAGNVWLSTAPQEPLTHWYQVRCLLPNPVFVRAGQRVSGSVLLLANERQSYDVEIEVVVEGTGVSAKNVLDLKNPFFRYTGIQTVAPPGNHSQSPTDAYWGNAGVVLNGGVLSNAVGSYGSTQGSGGGLFAYSSQAVGNVMATGTGSYTNQSIGSSGSYGNQGVVINSRYNPSTPAPTYGIYQAGYIQ